MVRMWHLNYRMLTVVPPGGSYDILGLNVLGISVGTKSRYDLMREGSNAAPVHAPPIWVEPEQPLDSALLSHATERW